MMLDRVLDLTIVGLSLTELLFRTLIVFLGQIVSLRFRLRETVIQMYEIAVESIPVIAFSLTAVGMMLVFEFSFHMKQVLGQDSLVPVFSTQLMFRELCPVISCLLLVSRVGASIAAEIGTMKVTDQLDALHVLSVDPVDYLVLPRAIACAFAGVTLSLIGVAVALVGGASIAAISLHYTLSQYWNSMFLLVSTGDLATCICKGFVFGSIIPIVASYHGLNCQGGAQGVGRATARSVVHGSMLIIIADFLLTYLLYAG